jgi:pyrroloquinoline quinone biosynthesis protein B
MKRIVHLTLVAIFTLTAALLVAADPFVVVLGIAQDAGYPQAACNKDCCLAVWKKPELRRFASSIAIVDPDSGERWLIDCTPAFPNQLRLLDEVAKPSGSPGISGVFLTHAHIGHYAGLIHLGREVIGSKSVPVHVMPRMKTFLERNGPWSQLVRLNNIDLRPITADKPIALNHRLSITAFVVPHRDEFSETVGYRIEGPKRSALFIPDIDKWERWDRDIESSLKQVDVAYVDGTFYAEGELPNRSMSEIPHPFIVESMKRFGKLPAVERSKIRFIHLNHTNPALRSGGDARRKIEGAGMKVAEQGNRFGL